MHVVTNQGNLMYVTEIYNELESWQMAADTLGLKFTTEKVSISESYVKDIFPMFCSEKSVPTVYFITIEISSNILGEL